MWHPEPFVKYPIPATHPPTAEEAARSLWFSPLRIGRVELSAAQIQRLNNLTPAAGERHDAGNMAVIDR